MKPVVPAGLLPGASAPLLLRPLHAADPAVADAPAWFRSPAFRGLLRPLRDGVPVGPTLAVAAGTILSLAPGLLPRSAAVQAVLTALMVVAALGVARLACAFPRTRRAPGNRPPRVLANRRSADDRTGTAVLRHGVATAATAGVGITIVRAASWQNTLRDAMGLTRTGPQYWCCWAVGALVSVTVLVVGGIGVARSLRRVGWLRGAVTAVVALVPVAFLGVSGTLVVRDGAGSEAVRPVAATRSGSADSLVRWESLGREGQRFVAGGRRPGAVRVYVGLRSAPDLAARVDLAVRELDRAGGFDRSHLVVAVPTGSGWVDEQALRGFDARFGADVAVAAVQYSQMPSWATFVLGRESAATAARALFGAVEAHAATLPDPPRLHLYGQSLGAFGGSAVFAGAAEQNRRACSVLWAGPPGGGGRESGARTAVLANTSDPVVHWSPELLWRPPNLTDARRDAPMPRWLPVVGFLQTTVDLLGALSAPPGHGHRYGVDQGTALPDCG